MFSTGDLVLVTLSGEGYNPQLTSSSFPPSPTATALTSTHKDTPQVRMPIYSMLALRMHVEVDNEEGSTIRLYKSTLVSLKLNAF